MCIDEYLTEHPEKLPKGRELMEFSTECEAYIDHVKDLVPYDDEHYAERVFDICIAACAPMDDEVREMYEGAAEYFNKSREYLKVAKEYNEINNQFKEFKKNGEYYIL